MPRRVLAFVLSGGGARGALQVGALRALLETGEQPELLVGTSIGACNSAYMAINGVSLATVTHLETLWREAAGADLLPPRYVRLTLDALLRRIAITRSELRIRKFWMDHGLRPDTRFGDILGSRLILVAADLNTGQPVLFGTSPDDNVFEGMLASSAIPPWIRPVRKNGRLLVDGGLVSTLPVEAAVLQGATEIVALDLIDPFEGLAEAAGLGPGLRKALAATQYREMQLELQFAAAHDVPVQRIELRTHALPPPWDFRQSEQLMALGYEITRTSLATRQPLARTRWWTARDWLNRSAERFARRGAA